MRRGRLSLSGVAGGNRVCFWWANDAEARGGLAPPPLSRDVYAFAVPPRADATCTVLPSVACSPCRLGMLPFRISTLCEGPLPSNSVRSIANATWPKPMRKRRAAAGNGDSEMPRLPSRSLPSPPYGFGGLVNLIRLHNNNSAHNFGASAVLSSTSQGGSLPPHISRSKVERFARNTNPRSYHVSHRQAPRLPSMSDVRLTCIWMMALAVRGVSGCPFTSIRPARSNRGRWHQTSVSATCWKPNLIKLSFAFVDLYSQSWHKLGLLCPSRPLT